MIYVQLIKYYLKIIKKKKKNSKQKQQTILYMTSIFEDLDQQYQMETFQNLPQCKDFISQNNTYILDVKQEEQTITNIEGNSETLVMINQYNSEQNCDYLQGFDQKQNLKYDENQNNNQNQSTQKKQQQYLMQSNQQHCQYQTQQNYQEQENIPRFADIFINNNSWQQEQQSNQNLLQNNHSTNQNQNNQKQQQYQEFLNDLDIEYIDFQQQNNVQSNFYESYQQNTDFNSKQTQDFKNIISNSSSLNNSNNQQFNQKCNQISSVTKKIHKNKQKQLSQISLPAIESTVNSSGEIMYKDMDYMNSKSESISSRKQKQVKKQKKQTKDRKNPKRNAVKNIGNQIIQYTLKNKDLIIQKMKTQLSDQQISEIQSYLQRWSNKILKIDHLRTLWIGDDNILSKDLHKVIRSSSKYFLQHECIQKILQSRKMKAKQAHLEVRFRLLKKIQNPYEFYNLN